MFFRKPSFGLDISDYSIEVVSLTGSLKNPKLLAMGRAILEPGIVEDGKILNKEKLKTAITNLVSIPQFGRIKKRECIFSLSESKVFVHFFEIPKGLKKDKQIEKIKTEVSQIFPLAPEDLYYDFIIYPEGSVLLVAAPKTLINNYLEIFKICKIKPIALEIESQSLGRGLLEKEEKTILITDIGARTTNFSLFSQGKLRLSTSLPIAGNKLTQTISEKLKISFSEAENLKIKIGLNPDLEGGRVFLILQEEFREIIEEIKKIEKYFQEKTGKQIEKIILTGGSTQLPYLSEYLADNLGKKIEIGDPWTKINIDILKKKEYLKEALKINPILYANAVGLALRGLNKNPKTAGINLIKEVK